MRLSDDQKRIFKELLHALDSNQKEVACRAGISEGALSEGLKPGGNKGFSDKTWAKVTEAVDAVFMERCRRHPAGDWAKAQGMLGRVRALEASGSNGNGGSIITPPGVVMGLNSANYIEREADRILQAGLERNTIPAAVIIGGMRSGRSSLLNRTAEAARSRGIRVLICDFQSGLAHCASVTLCDLFVYLFARTGIPADQFPEASPKDAYHDWENVFCDWARGEWRDESGIILIVDGLETIADTGKAAREDIQILVAFLNNLRSRSTESPFNRKSIVSVYSSYDWKTFHLSPFYSQAKQITLGPFSLEELPKLMSSCGVTGCSDADIGQIYKLFRGQPYLSHLFAAALADGRYFQDVMKAALNQSSAFWLHWRILYQSVVQLAGDEETADIILTALRDAAGTTNGHATSHKILRQHFEALKLLGLVEETLRHPVVSDFYLNHLNNL